MTKRLLNILCLICGVAFFSSCEKDDDNNSSNETNNQGVSESGKVGNYTYVDLGLKNGTKWATFNIGASKPEEYGSYFAWGETSSKETNKFGSSSSYKWCNGSFDKLTKYCIDSTYGTVDNLTTLLAEDDAATQNWGSEWRMPTAAECQELLDGCSWKWTEDFNGSGIAGRIGTSKTNGNTIFLPAAGYCNYEGLCFVGYHGDYWSSSLNENETFSALSVDCDHIDLYWSRVCGMSVRAVVK